MEMADNNKLPYMTLMSNRVGFCKLLVTKQCRKNNISSNHIYIKLLQCTLTRKRIFPELNVTVDESASSYPERILVFPSNSSGGRPRLHLMYAEDTDVRLLDNRLQETEGDEGWEVQSVLTVAALQYAALHNYSVANLGHMSNTLVSQMLPNGNVVSGRL